MLWNNHHCNYVKAVFQGGLSGDSVVENLSGNAGDTGLIPGLGRAPGEGNGNPLSTLAWKIPWIEKPGRPQPMGSQRVKHKRATSLSLFF